jgi:hypothetical protein
VKASELAPLLIGLVLSLFAMWLGSWDVVWAFLRVPSSLSLSFSWTLGILFLLVGFLISVIQVISDLRAAVSHSRAEMLAELEARDSHGAIRAIPSDRAFSELQAKLPSARSVWNTRVSHKLPQEPYPMKAGSDYGTTLWRAVREGHVNYREILTTSWATEARKSLGARSLDKIHGFSVIPYDLPSFNNFIVIEMQDGSKEMYLGWAVSRKRGIEQQCFHFKNPSVCDSFIAWHNELFEAGTPLTG